MQLLIISVCVQYLDFLKFCFNKNKESIQQHHYFIITDSKDISTQEFCYQNTINYFITDEFYKNGDTFNKGRAINIFLKQQNLINYEYEYILFLDSDCIINDITDPRADNVLNNFISIDNKDTQCLYSCGRRIYNTLHDYNNNRFVQGGCNHIGFFQLFHKSHIKDGIPEFRNASVYDCEFTKRFSCKKCLSCDVDHIGPIYMNWSGRHPHSKEWC
jgi:hypothetical protein